MNKVDKLEKETVFLYNKHNKTTNYKLEKKKIDFPDTIVKILNKDRARTKREKQVLEKFRNKILYDLFLQSSELKRADDDIKEKRNKEIQDKIKATRIENMKNNPNYICYFGVWINKEKVELKISRDSYAIINKKNSFKWLCKRNHMRMIENFENKDIVNREHINSYFDNYLKMYEDDSFETYTDEYCVEHQKDCLKNYDLNIKYFNSLDIDDFNNCLNNFVKKYKLKEVKTLDDYEKITGVYIMVLDEYKQVYIGKATDLKKRITQHWVRKKEFDKLIYGSINTSIISIDSFGAYDTTRIFVFPTRNLNEIERKFTEKMPNNYQLNRTIGGELGFDYISSSIAAHFNANKRNFDELE